MKKQKLYVSRDWNGSYTIWEKGKPQWIDKECLITSKAKVFLSVSNSDRFHFLFPGLELEPGQLAKVYRRMATTNGTCYNIPVFKLDKIIENHPKPISKPQNENEMPLSEIPNGAKFTIETDEGYQPDKTDNPEVQNPQTIMAYHSKSLCKKPAATH